MLRTFTKTFLFILKKLYLLLSDIRHITPLIPIITSLNRVFSTNSILYIYQIYQFYFIHFIFYMLRNSTNIFPEFQVPFCYTYFDHTTYLSNIWQIAKPPTNTAKINNLYSSPFTSTNIQFFCYILRHIKVNNVVKYLFFFLFPRLNQ